MLFSFTFILHLFSVFSEEELSRERFLSDRAPLESSDDLQTQFATEGEEEGTGRRRIPDDYENVNDADVIGATENVDNVLGVVDDAASNSPQSMGDTGDGEAAPSGSSVASPGDVKLVHRMSAALAGLFPASSGRNDDRVDTPVGDVPVVDESGLLLSEEEWRDLISFRATRELFLQELDEQRGRRAALSAEGFKSMGTAMKVMFNMLRGIVAVLLMFIVSAGAAGLLRCDGRLQERHARHQHGKHLPHHVSALSFTCFSLCSCVFPVISDPRLCL